MADYKPFVIAIHSDKKDDRLVGDIHFSMDEENMLCGSNFLGFAIQEFLQDEKLVEQMMQRVIGKMEMLNGDLGKVH